MSLSLGEKLRQAREERGISISEVAEQTRISPLYLEAIDADNYKTLPGGIFNKGFVRSYAKYVGIDEQEALQEYSRITAAYEQKEDEQFKSYRPEVLTDDRSASSIVPTVIFAVVILGMMTAGILFLVNYIQNQQSEPSFVTNTANVNANVPANVEPDVPAPAGSQAPTMDAVKVEFKTSGQAISLSTVTDGKSGVTLVTPDKPAVFEPKQQLKLGYSRSLAQAAQLSINGKSISLPTVPANPRRNVIEIDLTQDNLATVWQNGAVTFDSETAPTPANTAPQARTIPGTAAPSTAESNSTAPGTPAVARATPRPGDSPTRPAANVRKPQPTPASTPIIVGRPANTRRPTN